MTSQEIIPGIVEVEISSIIIPTDRQRKDLGSEEELKELAESIRVNRLLSPIILDSDNTLRAGRRRIAAFLVLGRTHIPARYFGDLDSLQQKVVEFDENHKRKQLSWQEEAAAIADIHKAMILSKKANLDPNRIIQAPTKGFQEVDWGIVDTAELLGIPIGKVSEDLTLASNLDNTRIAGRPSRKGALTTYKRERELAIVRELASRRVRSIITNPNIRSHQLGGGIIYNEDCRTILAFVESDSVGLIVTDPPWGIEFNESSQWTHKWVRSYDDNPNSVREMLAQVVPQLYRVLRPSNHIYCFYPIQESEWWINLFTSAGFIMRQRPLIWFKTGQQGMSDVYTNFLPTYEAFLWGWKPGPNDLRRLFTRAIPEAFGFPRQPGLYHENEKPVELLEPYIEASSAINEVVLDPFSGGGSSLAAAFSLGRYYIGCEADIINFNKSRDRLSKLEETKIEGAGGEDETEDDEDSSS